MSSSTLVALRVMVMLVCLVTVPTIAVMGTNLPGRFRDLWEEGLTASSAEPPVALRAPLAATAGEPGSPSAPHWELSGPNATPQGVEPAAIDSGRAATAAPLVFPTPQGQTPSTMGPNDKPADWSNTALPVSFAGPLATMETAAPPTDEFRQAQLQLKQLGAVHYLLETWGQTGELYRFQCQVAVGGNPHFTRHFEATDADPLYAMQRVLHEVATWRSQTQGR